MRTRLHLSTAIIGRLLVVLLCFQSGLRAAVYAPGGKSSSAETDALFLGETVLELSIEVDAQGLETLRANSSNRYNSPNRPDALATVREGTNIYQRVAIHLKGSAGSFRDVEQKPAFTLNFDEHIPKQRFHGLEKISLNNSVQDSTYMCEFLGRQIFNATSVPVPRAGHATVTFNGEPLGLYVLVEGWNKQFLKRHFPDLKGNLYEGAFRNDITAHLEAKSGADPESRSDLDAVVSAARVPDLEQRFAAMERVLDVDRFATFVALEVLLNHWDGYSLHVNNYRIFHDRRSGKLIFMPHGMDQLFGLRRREFDPQILPTMSGLVASALLETRAGRRLYLDRMAQLHTNAFNVPALTAAVDKLEKMLVPALQSDRGSLAEFNARVPVLRQRIEDRQTEIREQLAEMRTPKFDSRGEASLAGLKFKSTMRETFRRRRDRFGQQFGEANAGRMVGSWRAVVFLEGGRYRFQARVRTQIEQRAVSTEAINLRSSEGVESRRGTPANGWVVVEHDFALKDSDYVNLIYEFGAMDGVAALDKESLKLIRLDVTRGPTRTKRPAP
ncbi:MAG TPA: CotH kinase family protein [Methylomirabilota bacterium]|nr:CotH kinase family protein [Methylomirabilota bacterium]